MNRFEAADRSRFWK